MNCKITVLLVISLVMTAPFVLCGCGDRPRTTADSAGKPAGWSGKQIKLPDARNGTGGNTGGTPTLPTTH